MINPNDPTPYIEELKREQRVSRALLKAGSALALAVRQCDNAAIVRALEAWAAVDMTGKIEQEDKS